MKKQLGRADLFCAKMFREHLQNDEVWVRDLATINFTETLRLPALGGHSDFRIRGGFADCVSPLFRHFVSRLQQTSGGRMPNFIATEQVF